MITLQLESLSTDNFFFPLSQMSEKLEKIQKHFFYDMCQAGCPQCLRTD